MSSLRDSVVTSNDGGRALEVISPVEALGNASNEIGGYRYSLEVQTDLLWLRSNNDENR